jgi:hypothetical protein
MDLLKAVLDNVAVNMQAKVEECFSCGQRRQHRNVFYVVCAMQQ